jgi:cell wall-associated NlpC family hydrolase
VQVDRTCLRIAAWQTERCLRQTIHILVVLAACVALLATGAEARQITSVAKKPAVKKPALSNKAKAKTKKFVSLGNSELPALPPQSFTIKTAKPGSLASANSRDADLQLRGELQRYLGTRYKRGGTGGDGFDCSGFARSIYRKHFGVDLPHNAQSQFQLPMFAKLNEKALKTGDLVFFASTAQKKRINHVGIYLDDGQFIHAESKRGIVISSIDEEHWRNRLVSAKRLETGAGLKPGSLDGYSEGEDEQDEQDDPPETGMRVRYSSKEKRACAADRVAVNKSTVKKPQSFELEYVKPVLGKYCNLHIGSFREEFDLYGDDSESPLSVYEPNGLYSNFSYSQGIRIASDIKPFQWMSITPSFIYYNHGPELDTFDMPTRSLGVDVSLGSLADAGWSLSTGLQYASLSNPAVRSASRSSDPRLLDMSLTYSQRLSQRMQLSLMGLRSSVPDMSADMRSGSRADQRVFFMMNYNY